MRKRILLIGDSITEAFDAGSLLSEFDSVNKGVSGDSTIETLARINRNWFLPFPDYVSLCIGTNDMARGRSDSAIIYNIVEIIGKILTLVRPERFFVCSIFPTRDNPPRPNSRIRGLNAGIEKAAVKLDVRFLDLFDSFADDTGRLRKEFTEDGLHLTPSAYLLWAEKMRIEFSNRETE